MYIENNISTNGQQPTTPVLATMKMSDHWNSPLWEDFSYQDLIDEEEPPMDPEFGDLAGGLK